MMHSIRSTLHPGIQLTEPNFDTGEAYFHKLYDGVTKLQQAAISFSQHMRPILQAAHSFTDEIELLFKQDCDFHCNNALISSLRTRHDAMASNLVLNTLIEQLNTDVIQKLTNEIQRYNHLSDRIQEHTKTKQDKEYYTAKIEKLLSTRERGISSGKIESSSTKEKWDRNQEKLRVADDIHTAALDSLVDEFHFLWIHRQDVLSPIVLAFLLTEQRFVAIFENARKDLPNQYLLENQKPCDEAEQKSSAASVIETKYDGNDSTDLTTQATTFVVVPPAPGIPSAQECEDW